MENEIVGAKKRKTYKQNNAAITKATLRTSKESTPADSGIETIDLSSEHSGTTTMPAFRPPDLELLDQILEEIDVKPMKDVRVRRTARQASIEVKRSPLCLLKKAVVKHKLVKGGEVTDEAVSQFLPQVSIYNLSKEQLKELRRPWGFLAKKEIKDKYKFQARVIRARKTPTTGYQEVYVEWCPPGVLEDGWIRRSELSSNGMKVVSVTNLSWRQKMTIGCMAEMNI